MSLKEKYPPPKTGKTFRRRWNQLIGEITSRDNFKLGHLYQLEVLCDMYEEHEKLVSALDLTGFTYASDGGKYGIQYKQFPEVGQLNTCRGQIAAYSRMLGLVLAKDSAPAEGKEDETSSWK